MTAVRDPAIRIRQRSSAFTRIISAIAISATGANAPSPPGSSPANATPRRLPANEGKRLSLS